MFYKISNHFLVLKRKSSLSKKSILKLVWDRKCMPPYVMWKRCQDLWLSSSMSGQIRLSSITWNVKLARFRLCLLNTTKICGFVSIPQFWQINLPLGLMIFFLINVRVFIYMYLSRLILRALELVTI
jgi:hypothetical protein